MNMDKKINKNVNWGGGWGMIPLSMVLPNDKLCILNFMEEDLLPAFLVHVNVHWERNFRKWNTILHAEYDKTTETRWQLLCYEYSDAKQEFYISWQNCSPTSLPSGSVWFYDLFLGYKQNKVVHPLPLAHPIHYVHEHRHNPVHIVRLLVCKWLHFWPIYEATTSLMVKTQTRFFSMIRSNY